MIGVLNNAHDARAGNTAFEPSADACWRRTMTFQKVAKNKAPSIQCPGPNLPPRLVDISPQVGNAAELQSSWTVIMA